MKIHEEVKGEMRPEEVMLNELLREYAATNDNLCGACEELDREIERLQNARRCLAEPYEKMLADIETKIRLPMLDRKSSFISSIGKINFRKGAVRRTYNAEALDQLCVAKPEIKDTIWPFRTETVGEPVISIKLNGSEAQA